MGTGGPLEAAFTLRGPIPAGTWRFIGDGTIIQAVDMRWDIIWRAPAGDQVVLTFTHQFTAPPMTGSKLQPFEATADAPAVDAVAGDQLVLRFTATGATIANAYIPNGDAPITGGRVPQIELPQ